MVRIVSATITSAAVNNTDNSMYIEFSAPSVYLLQSLLTAGVKARDAKFWGGEFWSFPASLH